MKEKATQRLASLDVLRGFDLFCLVGLEGILHPLARAVDKPWFDRLMWNFSHVEWEGFSPWDLVMPLFLFMSGVSIPFAMQRYREGAEKSAFYRRILKRVALLWVFGMMCQGNLLGLNPDCIYLFSNTLQSIAVGYLVAALLYVHTSWRVQLAVGAGFLLSYWGLMQGVEVQGYGGGQYTPDANLAEWIDRMVLGRFRDGAYVENGNVVFAPWYRYTWILSSVNFAVTVMTGVWAGMWLRASRINASRKALLLCVAGVAMVAVGWLWHPLLPVIKKIWTSSMVLVSSGYCLLLMGVVYYLVDCRGYRRGTGWLRVYGMNSIAAYMMAQCVNFRSLSTSWSYGLEQYVGDFYPALVAISNSVILYVLLWMMYKKGVFLKV